MILIRASTRASVLEVHFGLRFWGYFWLQASARAPGFHACFDLRRAYSALACARASSSASADATNFCCWWRRGRVPALAAGGRLNRINLQRTSTASTGPVAARESFYRSVIFGYSTAKLKLVGNGRCSRALDLSSEAACQPIAELKTG